MGTKYKPIKSSTFTNSKEPSRLQISDLEKAYRIYSSIYKKIKNGNIKLALSPKAIALEILFVRCVDYIKLVLDAYVSNGYSLDGLVEETIKLSKCCGKFKCEYNIATTVINWVTLLSPANGKIDNKTCIEFALEILSLLHSIVIDFGIKGPKEEIT